MNPADIIEALIDEADLPTELVVIGPAHVEVSLRAGHWSATLRVDRQGVEVVETKTPVMPLCHVLLTESWLRDARVLGERVRRELLAHVLEPEPASKWDRLMGLVPLHGES